jgi:hypothetical protein
MKKTAPLSSEQCAAQHRPSSFLRAMSFSLDTLGIQSKGTTWGSDFYVSTFFTIENIHYRFVNNVPGNIPTRNQRSSSTKIE